MASSSAMLVSLPSSDQILLAFGNRLRATRMARGVDLHWLAERAEVPHLTLALAEQGRARLPSAELHRVVNALALPLGFLESDADPSGLRRFT